MAVNSPETRGRSPRALFTAILFEVTCNNYYITTKIRPIVTSTVCLNGQRAIVEHFILVLLRKINNPIAPVLNFASWLLCNYGKENCLITVMKA